MIRIVVVTPCSLVREGVCTLISAAPGMEVVAAGGDTALFQTLAQRPDVALVDVALRDPPALEVIEVVRERHPGMRVLVLSGERDSCEAMRAVRSGAHGLFAKTSPASELPAAILDVTRGRFWSPPELARRLAGADPDALDGGAPHMRLTPRECEIFHALARGERHVDLAARLGISPKTVSTHKARILEKLEVRNVSELVRYAIAHELV